MSNTSGWNPLWVMAYRNLLRNRRRSVATGIAIVFGFVGLLLLSGYIYRVAMGSRAMTVYLAQRGHVAVLKAGSLEGFSNKPWRFVLTPEDQIKIRTAVTALGEEVEFTGDFLSGYGLLSGVGKSAPVLINSVSPELYPKLVMHPELLKWTKDWLMNVNREDANKMAVNHQLVSVTPSLGTAVGVVLGDDLDASKRASVDVQLIGTNYYRDLNAVQAQLGITHRTGNAFTEDMSMIAPLPLLQELYATDGIEYLALFLRDAFDAGSVAAKLKSELGPGYEVVTYTDERWAQFYVGTMNFLYVMGQFFVVLILGAVALAIVNTTTLNLIERSRETGTLRAIGFSPKELIALYVREALLLSSISLVIGVSLAYLIAGIVNGLKIQFRPPGPPSSIQFMLVMHPGIAAAMGVLVFFITIASTALVVRKQGRVKVVALLNDQGA